MYISYTRIMTLMTLIGKVKVPSSHHYKNDTKRIIFYTTNDPIKINWFRKRKSAVKFYFSGCGGRMYLG